MGHGRAFTPLWRLLVVLRQWKRVRAYAATDAGSGGVHQVPIMPQVHLAHSLRDAAAAVPSLLVFMLY